MSIHLFGAIVTHHGTAANNRAETEGNITTLQKLLWFGRVHVTVSAEAIRFALRRRLAEHEDTNRSWDESGPKPMNQWKDGEFTKWNGGKESYIDDDLLGFMSADAAKVDGSDVAGEGGAEDGHSTTDAHAKDPKPAKKAKGTAKIRRSPLEISRAVSLTPYGGDVTFNAASPGATPSAQKGGKGVKDKPPVPYGTELLATRFQYGFALTPDALRERTRAAIAIEALCALGEVAGNHGRFLYDFSPESVVFRLTHDPAPRLLYLFEGEGAVVSAPTLLERVKSGDLPAEELIIGGAFSRTEEAKAVAALGATLEAGVRRAAATVSERLSSGGR